MPWWLTLGRPSVNMGQIEFSQSIPIGLDCVQWSISTWKASILSVRLGLWGLVLPQTFEYFLLSPHDSCLPAVKKWKKPSIKVVTYIINLSDTNENVKITTWRHWNEQMSQWALGQVRLRILNKERVTSMDLSSQPGNFYRFVEIIAILTFLCSRPRPRMVHDVYLHRLTDQRSH